VKVREKRKGSRVWWLFIDYQGRRKARRIGDRKAAELAAIKIRARLAEGDATVLAPAPASGVPTLAEYAEWWLTEAIAPHRKPRTEDYYRKILDHHLLPEFGKLTLTEIKPAQVRGFIAQKLNAKASRNTVKNMAATLRAILYQAQQMDELIPSNPAARFGKFFDARHDAREHVVVLEPEDVARVLKSATKWYADHELAVRMLFYTGMREGEMLGLRWEDIDWQRHLVDLRRTVAFRQHRLIVNTPKSGKLRTIDIPAALTASLRELHSIRQAQAVVEGTAMSPWIFRSSTDPDKPMNDAWFSDRVWRPLLEKAEVRHIRVHDARHTYASLMLRRGVPIAYVSKQLGHSSIQITVDLYGHFIPGADRHHVEGLAEAIEDAGRQLNATQPQPDPISKDHTES
jgi:integrase